MAFEGLQPFSPEAAKRLEIIKLRNTRCLSTSSPANTPPTRSPEIISPTSVSPPSAPEPTSAGKRSERGGSGGINRPGMGIISPCHGAVGKNASISKDLDLSRSGNPRSVDREGVGRGMEASDVRETWPDNGGVRGGLTDGGKSYDGFGGGVPPARHLRLRRDILR